MLGKLLKNERLKSNLSIRQLSKKIDLSTNYIKDIEKGYSIPQKGKAIIILSDFLGIEENKLKFMCAIENIEKSFNPIPNLNIAKSFVKYLQKFEIKERKSEMNKCDNCNKEHKNVLRISKLEGHTVKEVNHFCSIECHLEHEKRGKK